VTDQPYIVFHSTDTLESKAIDKKQANTLSAAKSLGTFSQGRNVYVGGGGVVEVLPSSPPTSHLGPICSALREVAKLTSPSLDSWTSRRSEVHCRNGR